MKPGRIARLIARPVWSGPRLKRKVAPASLARSSSSSFGTPSRVPRKVSTSILSASNTIGDFLEPQDRDSPTPYDLLGGDAGVRALVDRFYDLMDFEPGYRELRLVHGSTLESAREKLYLFLSGWLGGPPLSMARSGPPMLRARHRPFAIGTIERDQWLACRAQAREEPDVPATPRKPLQDAFFKTADWMRNKPG